MSKTLHRVASTRWTTALALTLVVLMLAPWCRGQSTATPASAPTATKPIDLGPDIVILKELADKYAPVPFEHKKHAAMAQMHGGCLTCHHRPPLPQTRPAATRPTTQPITQVIPSSQAKASQSAPGASAALGSSTTSTSPTTHPPTTFPVYSPSSHPATLPQIIARQDHSSETPACKTCHEVNAQEASIGMPSLKGAYHRQCLNCHREWMGENACGACHTQAKGAATQAVDRPTPGDILGRMHPPIPQPQDEVYHTRYTPADGPNVLFRHKQHTKVYGIPCAACHRKSNCSNCHQDGTVTSTRPRPVQPARTWEQSHDPCITCHRTDRCAHCHYETGKQPPPVFDHARRTGQSIDKDHRKVTCAQCHPQQDWKAPPTCGDASCHKPSERISFPRKRPGRWNPAASQPASTAPLLVPVPTTQPDKPTLQRIRN